MCSSIIAELRREGVLSMYHDYRSVTPRDWSGNGNDGAAVGVDWTSAGAKLRRGAGSITVPDAPSLPGDAVTMIFFCSGGVHDTQTPQRLISKYDGDGAYGLRIDGGELWWFDSAGTDHLTSGAFSGAPIYCLAAGASNGGTGKAFVNGIYAGDFSLTIAVAPNDSPLYIGAGFLNENTFLGPIASPIFVSRELTASEHSRLYGELMGTHWPTAPAEITEARLYHADYGAHVTTDTGAGALLGNTGFKVVSGTFRVDTSGTDKVLSCISSGTIYNQSVNFTIAMIAGESVLWSTLEGRTEITKDLS